MSVLNLMRRRKKLPNFEVPEREPERDGVLYYRMAGKKRRANGTWFRGENTNFHPMRESLQEPGAVERYVGAGWFPPQPFITRDHYITAFGSCFASHVTRYLLKAGYRVFGEDLRLNSHVIRSGDGIVNTAALLQQFEWAFEGTAPKSPVWHDADGSEAAMSSDIREATRAIFLKTDIFILTLGLSEVWRDKVTGDIFWRAVPRDRFNPDRHGFRVLGTEENRANLEKTYGLIRDHRPEAEIILTLSPIPLVATFRPVSCVTANSVSKASLRVAIDELMRSHEGDTKLHYFPSYEIVTSFLPDPIEDDLRHPRKESVDFIMATFSRNYCL